MRSISAAALRSFFSVESDDSLIALFTFEPQESPAQSPIYIADNYTKRLTNNNPDLYGVDNTLVYGVTYKGQDYMFLPVQITLPNDDNSSAPKATLTIFDVTYLLTETIRSITGPVKVTIELVLRSLLDNNTTNMAVTPEVTFTGFYITNFTYNAQQVTADLQMIDYATEPFPAYRFIPAYFPGIF